MEIQRRPLSIPHCIQDDEQVCFVHLGKTAGLTLISVLEKQFRPEEILPAHQYSEDLFNGVPKDHFQKYKLVRMHASYSQICRFGNPARQLLLTILREPVSRTISTYYYARSKSDHHLYPYAQELSLEDFLDLRIRNRYDWSDYQTHILTDDMRWDVAPDLELAKRRLRDDFIWVGLTERFDELLDLLSYTFCWPLGNDHNKVNVTQNRPQEKDISQKVIDKIVEINQLDIELYRYAIELFEERFSWMQRAKEHEAKFGALINNFRSRLKRVEE